MSVQNPRYYKWYPTVSCDLGTMPFEGDWTSTDRIITYDSAGLTISYFPNLTTGEWGHNVTKKVNGRMRQVWEPGVTVYPVEISGVAYPVWFMYCGDGVCTVKLPNGEQPEPYEP